MNSHERKNYLEQIIKNENEQIRKLHTLVSDSISGENLLTTTFYDQDKPTFGDRLADKVASFGGSWTFIVLFLAFIFVWMGLNSYWLSFGEFDPYPYILLNLVLSCIAALQAPIIMMSQNRKDSKDRKRNESDYLINLKAEIEIRNLHGKIDLVMLDQLKKLLDIQKEQLEILDQIKKSAGVLEG